ncbi:MAG: hypothetical protein IH623_07015 [Verrucomicrobia bacterium]|nr:hypothetical protein [Verrucomicrobiota bacterium]
MPPFRSAANVPNSRTNAFLVLCAVPRRSLSRLKTVFAWATQRLKLATYGPNPKPDCLEACQKPVPLPLHSQPMSNRALVWLSVLICLLPLFGEETSSAQEYTVEGVASFECIRAPDEPAVFFRLTVSGCKWYIRMTWPDNLSWDYVDASFDGENLYYLSCMETWVNNQRLKGEKVGDNIAVARISKTAVLHDAHAHAIAPVCFAYASGCYLDNVKDSRLEPIIFWPLSTGIFSIQNVVLQETEITRHPAVPHLPTRVVFFDDGLERNGTRAAPPFKRARPYDTGFTNAILVADSFTNVNGFALPTAAFLVVFAPKDQEFSPRDLGKTSNDLLRFSKYQIMATNFQAGSSMTSFVPRFPGITLVTDERFVDRALFQNYKSSSGFLSEADITNSHQFAAMSAAVARLAPMRYQQNANVSPWLVRLVLLAVVASPLLYFCLRAKGLRNGEAETTNTNPNKKKVRTCK